MNDMAAPQAAAACAGQGAGVMTALTETGAAKAPAVARVIRDDALARLRYGWGEAYRIGWDAQRGWWAQRRDNLGGDITGASDLALWDSIKDNYNLKPVPRDVGPGQKAVT